MPRSSDAFAGRLLAWFDDHGRHDLPWQHDPTPYRVWVSEIMLQQTQVATVIPYYERFMASFPDVGRLAAAPVDDVLHHWSGLGYYARARNLHKTARIVAGERGGCFGDDIDELVALPGLGRSTAAAILALSMGQRQAILDGNVKRVLTRYHGIFGWPGTRATEKALWDAAWSHTPRARVADYTQAIMDLGATLCTRSRPACALCPQRDGCYARRENAQALLPERKPKNDKPVRRQRMLVVRDAAGAVLLVQRPPTGIWGGLFSLPEIDDGESPEDWCAANIGMAGALDSEWPVLRQTFSHFHLDITPVCVDVGAAAPGSVEDAPSLWYNLDAPPSVGVAAPVARLLQAVRAE